LKDRERRDFKPVMRMAKLDIDSKACDGIGCVV
jgi:hypothetical protein